MYIKWTSHCKTEQEKAQFEADIRRAKPVLNRLKDILEQNEEMIERDGINVDNFSSPSWPYLQAYLMGSKSTIKDIKQLIDLDKQKDTTNE